MRKFITNIHYFVFSTLIESFYLMDVIVKLHSGPSKMKRIPAHLKSWVD